MTETKEEMNVMKDKIEEEYKNYWINNGINYDLKVAQRERQFKARMKSIICPGCDKEMRYGS